MAGLELAISCSQSRRLNRWATSRKNGPSSRYCPLFYRLSTDCNATILRREGRVFVPKASSVLDYVEVLLSRLNIRLVRIVKRRTVSTKIFIADLPGWLCESLCSLSTTGRELKLLVLEGFCLEFCPFLNGVRRGARYFRPLACVELMHSVIALCSLARLAQMSTPNTLTGKGNTS